VNASTGLSAALTAIVSASDVPVATAVAVMTTIPIAVEVAHSEPLARHIAASTRIPVAIRTDCHTAYQPNGRRHE
jgi:hypothetical protein